LGIDNSYLNQEFYVAKNHATKIQWQNGIRFKKQGIKGNQFGHE